MPLRWRRIAGPALILAGAVVIADAILRGAARLYLVVIVPVVTGGSWEFGLGVVLLVGGVLLAPLALAEPKDEEAPAPGRRSSPPPSAPSVDGGGLVLIGPVPIFFGSYRNPTRTVYWLAVLLGGFALALAVVFVWLVR